MGAGNGVETRVEARLGDLVRKYGRLIRSVVARVSGRSAPDIGDDVQQRIVTSLWQQIRREQTIEFPASYVYRCAVRETVRAMRREQALEASPLDEETPAPGPQDAEKSLAARELADAVERCILRLPEDRQLAVRGHLAGLTVDELMESQGWPYQKARNLIARGMADLRRLVRERGLRDG